MVVHISRDNGVFEKGYDHNWSEEYLIATGRLPWIPPVYRIKDLKEHVLKGVFYEKQLQSVLPDETYPISKILKPRGNRVLVGWRGWPSPYFDSWIHLEDVCRL